jgi:hypothetical protein
VIFTVFVFKDVKLQLSNEKKCRDFYQFISAWNVVLERPSTFISRTTLLHCLLHSRHARSYRVTLFIFLSIS